MTIHELELIYNSYYHVALKYCDYFNLSKEEMEDVIMNVFAIILFDLPKYRVNGIKSFIVTSAKYQCVDIIRRNKLKQLHLQTVSEDIHDSIEQIEKADATRCVLSIIEQLPPQQ